MIKIDITKKLHGSIKDMKLDIDIDLKSGEFIALFGESGSGKTTLLRVLAGVEKATGIIKVDNEIWLNNQKSLKPQKRDIGFCFQDFALFENMTVIENLLYVKSDLNLANQLLDMTKLTNLKNRMPNNLSGGQKQRLSLCRALMKQPKILLLDEPFSALDASMKEALQQDIIKLHQNFKTTTILVSHDISEIYRLCSRVIVIKDGKIIDDANPMDLFFKKDICQTSTEIAKILDITQLDGAYVALIMVGNRLTKSTISKAQALKFKKGDKVYVKENLVIMDNL